jgi:Putative metal-binding motif
MGHHLAWLCWVLAACGGPGAGSPGGLPAGPSSASTGDGGLDTGSVDGGGASTGDGGVDPGDSGVSSDGGTADGGAEDGGSVGDGGAEDGGSVGDGGGTDTGADGGTTDSGAGGDAGDSGDPSDSGGSDSGGSDSGEPLPDPVDIDLDGYTDDVDCDDSDPAVNPGASEVCDNFVDDDCDGSAGACARTGTLGVDDADWSVFGEVFDTNLGGGRSILLVPDTDGDGRDDLLVGLGIGPEADVCGGLYLFRGGSTATELADADWWTDDSEHCEVGTNLSYGDFDADGVMEVATEVSGGDDGAGDGAAFIELDGSGYTALSDVDTMISGESGTIDAGGSWLTPDGVTGSVFAVLVAGDGADTEAVHLFLPPVVTGTLKDSDAVILNGPDWDRVDQVPIDVGDLDGDGFTSLALRSVIALKRGYEMSGVAVLDALPSSSMYVHEAEHLYPGIDRVTGASIHASRGGDLDGDGYGDLLLREYSETVGKWTSAGCVFIFPGPLDAGATYSDAPTQVCGAFSGADFGYNADGSGDLDANGVNDLVATQAESTEDEENGWVGVFYGPLATGVSSASDADLTIDGSYWGHGAKRVASGGDWDGDGVDDFVVGAPGDATYETDAGAAFLFLGQGL